MKLKCLACEALAREAYLCAARSPHVVDVEVYRLGLHRDPSDLRARLPRLAQRVLYLAGARDTLVPPAAGDAAARLAARGVSRVVAGAGHAPFLARPGEVAAGIGEFLGRGASRGENQRHA